MSINFIEGEIYEVSENFIKVLKAAGIKNIRDVKDLCFSEKKRYISELFPNLNFEEV